MDNLLKIAQKLISFLKTEVGVGANTNPRRFLIETFVALMLHKNWYLHHFGYRLLITWRWDSILVSLGVNSHFINL